MENVRPKLQAKTQGLAVDSVRKSDFISTVAASPGDCNVITSDGIERPGQGSASLGTLCSPEHHQRLGWRNTNLVSSSVSSHTTSTPRVPSLTMSETFCVYFFMSDCGCFVWCYSNRELSVCLINLMVSVFYYIYIPEQSFLTRNV